MALIPGSYARAAGLQSEINKVTITRVAGSEVQFRRTIDTYQKDLRYNVNQIGREQKLLRRSMRKYYKKLREGKKERKEREAKEREDLERQRLHAKQFKEAEEAVRRTAVVLNEHKKEGGEDGEAKNEAAPGQESEPDQQNAGLATLPESPDSGLGSEGDDSVVGKVEAGKRKVFLTSQKAKMPYLKAKRGQREKTTGNKQTQKHSASEEEAPEDIAEKEEEGIFLPVINEEGEDGTHQCKHSSAKAFAKSETQDHHLATHADPVDNDTEGNSKDPHKPTILGRSKVVPVTSLNTKNVSTSGDNQTEANGADNSPSNGEAGQPRSRKPSFVTMAALVMMTTKASKRKKANVSYSDLIKLQHTHSSGTKRLFNLVDRLASKHGIGDTPPPARSSRSTSLDPRSNVKIKKRGNGPESQMSDVMVKQAAALYAMKYGYRVPDDVIVDDVIPPHVLLSDVSDEVVGEKELEQLLSERGLLGLDPANGRTETTARMLSVSSKRQETQDGAKKEQAEEVATEVAPRKLSLVRLRRDSNDVIRSEQTDGQPDSTPRRLSVTSVRRNSTDVTSPHYAYSDAASTIFQDMLTDGAIPSTAADVRERRTSRSKNRQTLSMSELSQQASRVRERSFYASHSLTVDGSSSAAQLETFPPQARRDSRTLDRMSPRRRDSRTLDRMSPVQHRSRSLSRARRDSVRNQLQQRLSEQNEAGNMAWQSAFGRLKVLHTLYDLSQHFAKDSS